MPKNAVSRYNVSKLFYTPNTKKIQNSVLNFLSKMLELKETFKKEVKSLKDYILLITVDSRTYQKAYIDIVKFLVNEQGTPGIYVTLNKPYEIIQRNFAGSNIDSRLIIFVDATSRAGGTRKVGNCLYIGGPEKLSDMSVAMDQAVKALSTEEKFLIFDSLSTLSIFNSPGTVARFIHFLAGKMREWKVKGVIITLEKETKHELLEEIAQFSDARIDLGGEP